jgi:short-subunit dehydrogenase involved in D-alanine esterification of teichoic acids
MSTFDFKKFHLRAMNAATEQEKQEINQELKDLYANLNDEDKKVFNEELQSFLIKEYAAINSMINV